MVPHIAALAQGYVFISWQSTCKSMVCFYGLGYFFLPEEPQFLFQGKVVLQTHGAPYVISSPTNQDTRRNQPGTYVSAIP